MIREKWLEAALEEWAKNVRDTQKGYKGDLQQIQSYFEANGWGGWLGAGGYTERPETSWCGQFAGAMAQRAGLDHNIAQFVMPSTARLFSGHKWNAAGVPMANRWRPRADGETMVCDHTAAMLTLEELLGCNVVVLATIAARDYGDKRNMYGGHIVLIEGLADGGFETIEGNAVGELGNGKWGEGVVRRRGKHARKWSDLRIVYELTAKDHFEDQSKSGVDE